jgi:prefoldin subunit 5
MGKLYVNIGAGYYLSKKHGNMIKQLSFKE